MRDDAKTKKDLIAELQLLRAQLRTYEKQGSGKLVQELETQRRELEEALAALSASEGRFRRLAESGLIGIITATFDGRIVDANDAFLHMLGYTREELLAGEVRWDEITPREYWAKDAEVIEEMRTHGAFLSWEKEYFRKDGGRVAVLVGVAPLEGREEAICFVLDVSEQRRTEEALRLQEERMRIALQGSSVVVFNQDCDLRYTWIYNPVPGFEMERAVGKTDAELAPPEYARRLTEIKQSVLDSGRRVREEIWLPTLEGLCCYDLTIEPLLGANGAVEGITCAAIDITERKRAEDAMRFLSDVGRVLVGSLGYEDTLRHVTRLLVPTLADWCVVETDDGQGRTSSIATHADPNLEPLLHELMQRYPPRPSPHHPARQVLQSGKPAVMPEMTDALMEAVAEDETHLRMMRQLGPKSSLLVPLVARGQTLGVMALLSKQAQRYGPTEVELASQVAQRAALAADNARLYEEAQRAIRAREQFLTVASHEIRTPLTTIKGHTDLLLRRAARSENLDERISRSLQTIQQETGRLNRLMDLLLDLSRIRSGQLNLESEVVDLGALVRQLVDTLRPTLQNHTVELVGVDDIFLIHGDALRLEQVLHNLLSNAIKYSPDGGPVTLEMERQDGHVRVSISDQGLGISSDDLPHLFDEFYRSASGELLGIKGTGLGLYIVRRLVEAHDGTIQVRSEVGTGSTFTVQLPLAR